MGNEMKNNIEIERSLVSIVVPVFNVEDYLDKCIESIRAQTYSKIEIILVDDGSTDSSGIICDQYASQDGRIVVVHKKNGGLSSARNQGIEYSKGEYIAFIDSDDYIAPGMIRTLLKQMDENDADLGYGGYVTFDENGIKDKCVPDNIKMTGFESLRVLSGDSGVVLGIVVNKLYKKALFEDIRFPEGKYHEDVFVMHEVLDRCRYVCGVKESIYYYRQRAGSITKETYSVKHLDCVEAFYSRYSYYRKKGDNYLELLQAAGEDLATVYYQSKIRFKPITKQEKQRVEETNKMARDVCFDRFGQWSFGLKMKLLMPHLLMLLSRHVFL